MTTPPSLSPEQRQAALAKAAEARRVRSEVKSKLKMQMLTLEEILAQADEDEIIAKRDELIASLQQRLQEKTSNETLFSVRWQVT